MHTYTHSQVHMNYLNAAPMHDIGDIDQRRPDVVKDKQTPSDGLSADILIRTRRFLSGLHQEDLCVKDNLTHVRERRRKVDHCRLKLVVGAVCLLFDDTQRHGNEIVELDKTRQEESAEPLHRVIGGGVSVWDDEVSMATVTLDEREEDGNSFVLSVMIQEPSDETTVGLHGYLPQKRPRG